MIRCFRFASIACLPVLLEYKLQASLSRPAASQGRNHAQHGETRIRPVRPQLIHGHQCRDQAGTREDHRHGLRFLAKLAASRGYGRLLRRLRLFVEEFTAENAINFGNTLNVHDFQDDGSNGSLPTVMIGRSAPSNARKVIPADRRAPVEKSSDVDHLCTDGKEVLPHRQGNRQSLRCLGDGWLPE
jgi:hypothetical protein